MNLVSTFESKVSEKLCEGYSKVPCVVFRHVLLNLSTAIFRDDVQESIMKSYMYVFWNFCTLIKIVSSVRDFRDALQCHRNPSVSAKRLIKYFLINSLPKRKILKNCDRIVMEFFSIGSRWIIMLRSSRAAGTFYGCKIFFH